MAQLSCFSSPIKKTPSRILSQTEADFSLLSAVRQRRTLEPREFADKTAAPQPGQPEKCERRDLNPHPFRDWILSPARLPIPPLSRCCVATSYVKLLFLNPPAPTGRRQISNFSIVACCPWPCQAADQGYA